MKFILGLSALLVLSTQVFGQVPAPQDGRYDIWANIPFVGGANLCNYADAYGQTRTENLNKMAALAKDIMSSGAAGLESAKMLVVFNDLYDQNQKLASQKLDITLEATLKSYIDQYYRDLKPKVKRVSFNQNKGTDFVAYGTYTFAPDCKGTIEVTLHLVGKDGVEESYVGTGKPATVMSQIGSQIFTQFQRTQFPSVVKIGNKSLNLVGAINGSVDKVRDPQIAEEACKTLDARLPTATELEQLDLYGDWSGGVSLTDKVWALAGNKVYWPDHRSPSPVRDPWEVYDDEFLYYCVK